MFNAVPENSLIMAAVIFFLLVTATASRLLLKYRHPEKDFTELRQRIQSWWWMVAILLGVLLFNKTLAIIFFGFLSFLILKEFFSIVPTRHSDRRVIFWAYLAIPIQYIFISKNAYDIFIIFIPVYVFLFLPLRMVLIGNTENFLRSIGIIHWGSVLAIFCIGHIAYLLQLPVKNISAGYMGPVIFLVFITQLNDVAQFIWGKLFGKHKITPKVSPNKTWEGFIGGFCTVSLTSAVLAPLLSSLTAPTGLLCGALISCAGFIGDIVISAIKRDLDIKDSGTLIPGHGGILDRVDSLIYTSPIFFHFLRILG